MQTRTICCTERGTENPVRLSVDEFGIDVESASTICLHLTEDDFRDLADCAATAVDDLKYNHIREIYIDWVDGKYNETNTLLRIGEELRKA